MGVAAMARRGHRLGAQTVLRDHMIRVWRSGAIAGLLLAGCLAALPLGAKTLRYASGFDPQSMDPHGLALQYQTRVTSQIYESLVGRDRNFALEPQLALAWERTSPQVWRFKLRPDVT